MLTLGQAKNSRLNRISGLCPDTADFLELLNDATRELMARGNWWGTVVKMRVCVYSDCFAIPRYVGTVLATNVNNQRMPIANHWYEFMDVDKTDWCCNRIWTSNVVAEADGQTPVFQNIPCGQVMPVRIYPNRQADLGKIVTIFGIDRYGQVVRTLHSDGTFAEGEELTLVLPYVQSVTEFRTITRIIKPATEGILTLYGFVGNSSTSPTGESLIQLAQYEPWETLPSYRHMRIHRYGTCASVGCCPNSITMLSKLAFVPVVNDNDLILIDNLDALALAMQSIKKSDAYDDEEAEKAMMRAVHRLNLDLRDKFPNDSIPANVAVYGTASLRNQGIGSLM